MTRWFGGGVATAIQVSRKNSALLVVFLTDGSDNGEIMNAMWEALPDSIFTKSAFVAVRLEAGSEAASHFTQIYPSPIVPSLFLIDNTGRPLDTITFEQSLTEDSFMARIEAGFLKFSGSAATSDAAATVSAETPASTESWEEREKKTRQLIAERVAKKDEEKAKEEREREANRVRDGKQLAELKREREEAAIREAAEERRREKIATEEARERLRRQLQIDKEERAARFARQSGAQPAAAAAVVSAPAPPKAPTVQSDTARIQARLLSGKAHVYTLAATDNLGELRKRLVADGVSEAASRDSTIIVTPHPRKVFSEEEETQKTLADLALTPSAALLILPATGLSDGSHNVSGRSATVTATSSHVPPSPSSGGLVAWVLGFLATPLNVLYAFFGSLFGSVAALPPDSNNSPPSASRPADNNFQQQQQPSASGQQGGSGGGGPSAIHSISSMTALKSLQSKLAPGRLVVIDFYADWCGPCKAIAPFFELLASRHPNSTFVKVNVDHASDVSSAYGVRAMPTFVLVKDGREVARIQGASASELESAVDRHERAGNWNGNSTQFL